MSSFDVRVFAIRRRPGRTAFEVRWRVAGRDKSRSFMTWALADSYRAELVRAARQGAEFDPGTGEPESWTAPEAVTVTWYRHAMAYAELKWPRLAPHSRASLADALATVTPLLTRETGRRPPEGTVRAALYGHAFNPQQRRSRAPDPGTVGTLAWLERVSLPVSQLSDPHVIRTALDGLCTRLDGSPAAANTISRKRAVFHAALGYAVELGLLPANPVEKVRWHAPKAAVAVSPATVASPSTGPGDPGPCLARPAGTGRVLRLPVLRGAAPGGSRRPSPRRPHPPGARPRDDHPHRDLPAHRHRLDQHRRRRTKHAVSSTAPTAPSASSPSRLSWAGILRRHLRDHGTAPDGRLFRGTRGGMLSESVYGRDLARRPPGRARPGTGCYRARASPLRPAACRPVLVAERQRASPPRSPRAPGTALGSCMTSTCTASTARKTTLASGSRTLSMLTPASRPSSQWVKASGYTDRRLHPRPCPLYVREPVPGPAHSPRPSRPADPRRQLQTSALIRVSAAQTASESSLSRYHRTARSGPRIAHGGTADGLRNRSLSRAKAGDAIQRHRL